MKLGEIKDFVRKARAKSSLGINGISCKLYKKCSKILALLWKLLQEAYTKKFIVENWGVADGIHIPKKKRIQKIDQFQPISLLHIEGKIFFGVTAKRMMRYMIKKTGMTIHQFKRLEFPAFQVVLNIPLYCWTE